MQGFIISTDQNRERNALKEAYNFLNEYCESIYPTLKGQEKEEEVGQTVQQGLEKELAQLNSQEEKVFYQFQTGIKKGIVFIKVSDLYTDKVDVMALYSAIMADIHLHKKIITKNCHRLIPVQKALKADIPMIRSAV